MSLILTKLLLFVSSLLPRARQGERGSILILGALSAVVVIGSAGLAVDVSRLYAAKAEISRAVDAAALAGVLDFDGTAGGLTNAQNTAYNYLKANEPGITSSCPTAASCITADGATNKMTIKANKTVRLYFLALFGFNTAPVYGHAVAGFQNQTIDAVMVIDSTGSMDGTPINNAKSAATNFVNSLLGTSPSGNVVVGATPFRGCNRGTTQSATVPFLASDGSHTLCVNQNSEITGLTSTKSTLTTGISNICPSDSCPGGSGTNICTGIAKGWEVLEGAGNHVATPNNRRYLVLLTDGDNYYNGAYTYASSPYASPLTYQTWPCQPPSSCSGFSGTPCHAGTWTGSPVTVATEGFETNNFSGGTGWTGNWTQTNSPQTASGSAQAGTYKVQLNQTDAIKRQIDLSTVSDASMSFYIRTASTWTTSDRFYVETSPDNSTWTTRATFGISGSGQTVISGSYAQFSVSLTSLVGDASAYVRFRSNITSGNTHYAYIDAIVVTDPATTSDGYLNGTDGSSGSTCSSVFPRERQLDIETLNMARAAKLDGVEIFVVAFGTCNGSDATVYNNGVGSQCNPSVQIAPAAAPSPAGPIGNTDGDDTADNRLLKCVASSSVGTNDHYFYAASATDLPNIFTTIAAQIAHRLVE